MASLVRYSRWLSRLKTPQKQLLNFSTSAGTSDTDQPTRPSGPPPIRVALTDSAGRGVFATRRIGAGELIHTADPVVSHPSLSASNSVCYFCLIRLSSTPLQDKNVAFCSPDCEEKAYKGFCDVEKKVDWSDFHEYCRTRGLKYPFLVKRLACMVMSGAASANCLDILQPASLSRELAFEMEEGFNLLRAAFSGANIADEVMLFLSKQWYNNVMARIRINAFRVEPAVGSYEDFLSSAAACVEAEAAVGNAVYMLPSFYNHDCDPNTHIIWVENAKARLKALSDIEADEELRICYIDASMDRDARQTLLFEGFGFKCNCLRCSSGD